MLILECQRNPTNTNMAASLGSTEPLYDSPDANVESVPLKHHDIANIGIYMFLASFLFMVFTEIERRPGLSCLPRITQTPFSGPKSFFLRNARPLVSSHSGIMLLWRISTLCTDRSAFPLRQQSTTTPLLYSIVL